MAVEKEIKFGLNVNRSLADIVSNTQALANLGVNIDDLDVIRNAAGDLNITADDIKSLSGLNVPLPEYLTRLLNDTQQYSNIINQTAGTTETLKGNLTINGVLGAGAIKYRYIDEDNTTLKVADISTSRVSSWSSTESPSDAQSPIFYGSQIEVDGQVLTPELEILTSADTVRFRDSEAPTHKIQASVGGQTMYFYAMKGIPLIFEGFFRNLDCDMYIKNPGKVSWRIVNVATSYLTREYENVGPTDTRSFLRYRDTRAAQKNIEIYHNPNNITILPLTAAGISKLPAANLENLSELKLDRNVIKTVPDFTQFCPNIRVLDLRENPFELGEDPDLRKFNQNVLERIPTSVTELRMGNTFYGSITAQMRPGYNEERTTDEIKKDRTYEITNNADFDFTTLGAEDNNVGTTFKATSTTATVATFARVEDITTGLPNLITLNLSSHSRGGARSYFDRDGDDPTGSTPEVSDTVQNYYMYRHSFDSIPQSVKDLPDLRNIDLYANTIIDTNFSIASDKIVSVNIGASNRINVPNLSNKTTLETFYAHYNRLYTLGSDYNMFVTESGAYKFAGCTNLKRLYMYNISQYGPIPKFAGNPALYEIDANYSGINGGKVINASNMEDGKEYQIYYNPTPDDFTLVGAANSNKGTIFTADLSLSSITSNTPKVVDREYVLHADTFDDCAPSLVRFRMASGGLLNAPMHPDVFKNTTRMQGITFRSYNRGVSGNLPSLSSMTDLRFIEVLQNNLTGPLPNLFNNPRVYYTHFYGNRFSGTIPTVESPSLAYAYWHANQLTGFNGLNCPNMRRLFISYNQITGAFPNVSNMERMYDLYVNNNNFTDYIEGAVAGCRALRAFDISNNPNLPVGAVNQIIADLVANYELNPRSGVSVNLRNTATPTGEAVEQIEFLRSKGWNMRL
jgi:Leucine-rich repeat (LRR) protein